MEVKVLWSNSAILDLQAAHDFYKTTAGLSIADKITLSIVSKTLLLAANPRMGQIEEILKHRKDEIRYLVEGNYKIIYIVREQIVLIASVFDCRQAPENLAKKSI